MNLSLLLALILAFGLGPDPRPAPMAQARAVGRAEVVALLALAPALIARAVGLLAVRRLDRRGPSGARRRLIRWERGLEVASLALYAWVIYGLDWTAAVLDGFGLRGAVLLDEAATLAPFLAFQALVWWGLVPAERWLRPAASRRPGRLLLLKIRQGWGLVLPAGALFTLAIDLVRRYRPELSGSPVMQLAGLAVMGGAVLVLAPALVRLSWPTRPLPRGPLRDRLAALARRLDFRYTDILVWDTEATVVNAGVTGALPWFRYVLLTDLLIATLDDDQIEAVFGHEVGHIAHRHLGFFGFFFVGSVGLMALLGQGFAEVIDLLPGLPLASDPGWWAVEVGAGLAWLLVFGLYVLLVFGYLSRRFERQADVFGCRAVSCGRPDCPDHVGAHRAVRPAPATPCRTGIRTFADALMQVALLNGMEPRARSWRHGSIRDRIAFLEALQGSPESERRFQSRVRRLRLALAIALLGALIAAYRSGALNQI